MSRVAWMSSTKIVRLKQFEISGSPTASEETTVTHNLDTWALLGLVMLCVRLVQGWVYWGGAQ